MARTGNSRRGVPTPKLYTLSEVAHSISVSIPTVQRYKKLYQKRIPVVGVGRGQRYPQEALAVFAQIKSENLEKRGRPRKANKAGRAPSRRRSTRSAARPRRRRGSKPSPPSRAGLSSPGRPTSKQRKAASPTLLTLTEISRRTGISYPTCINYVKRHLDRIPHVGMGRRRRYPPRAVAVFRALREQSRPQRSAGRRPTRDRNHKILLNRIRELEKAQLQLSKRLDRVLKLLDAPLKVTIKRG